MGAGKSSDGDQSPRVLIVGAGPTGLTLACALARAGIRIRLIDRADGPAPESRALAIHARTLEIFSQLGLADEFLAKGCRAPGVQLFVRGRKQTYIDLTELGDLGTRFGFILMLEQSHTERILLAKLHRLGVQAERRTEFVGLRQTKSGVEVRLQTNPTSATATSSTTATITSTRIEYGSSRSGPSTEDVFGQAPTASQQDQFYDFVVGCDGARSSVRHSLNIPFEGGTYGQVFLLADARVRSEVVASGGSQRPITISLTEFGPTVFFPLTGKERYRVISIVPQDLAGEQDHIAGIEQVERITHRNSALPLELSEPEWISVYRLHHRRARRFYDGRVFLAGDAAHVHSPAGGQGMNTGIQDAWNLGWKLAMLAGGSGRAALQESYHEERFKIAGEVLNLTDRAFQTVVSRNPLARQARLLIAPIGAKVVSSIRWIRGVLIRRLSQIGLNYRGTALARHCGKRHHKKSPRPGDRAPPGNLLTSAGKRFAVPDDLAPLKACLIAFVNDGSLETLHGLEFAARPFAGDIHAIAVDLSGTGSADAGVHVASETNPSAKNDQVAQPSLSEAGDFWQRMLPDQGTTSLAQAWRTAPGYWYLIRADGYIGACGGLADSRPLKGFLEQILTPAGARAI